MNRKVRVRYAPSPTGFLHIGNARTALYNYIFAKHYKGDFIIRIEDTDIDREVEGAIESQFKYLNWIGIHEDESIYKPKKHGPYQQLIRNKNGIYKKYIDELLENGYAYRCFCSKEDLDALRKHQKEVLKIAPKYNEKCRFLTKEEIENKTSKNEPFNIRLKCINKDFTFQDMVRGEVTFKGEEIGDWIIIKNNGIPTYNFAVVIDDYLMEISHVIRGEEHISNTPKQQMLYEYFKWEEPIFAHLNLIVNQEKKKLSKRDTYAIQYLNLYEEKGYLPSAIINFLSLLGWSPKGEKEIFTLDELINIFDEKRFSKSSSMFDVQKLEWLNSNYIKNMEDNEYINTFKPFIFKFFPESKNLKEEIINFMLLTYKKEIHYGEQLKELLKIYFERNIEIANKTKTYLKENFEYKQLANNLLNSFNEIEKWDELNIKEIIKKIGKELNIKGKNLFMPTRIITTTLDKGPEIAKIIFLLGKNKVINNIQKVL